MTIGEYIATVGEKLLDVFYSNGQLTFFSKTVLFGIGFIIITKLVKLGIDIIFKE